MPSDLSKRQLAAVRRMTLQLRPRSALRILGWDGHVRPVPRQDGKVSVMSEAVPFPLDADKRVGTPGSRESLLIEATPFRKEDWLWRSALGRTTLMLRCSRLNWHRARADSSLSSGVTWRPRPQEPCGE